MESSASAGRAASIVLDRRHRAHLAKAKRARRVTEERFGTLG
jgi:hypothetical protein